MSLFWNHGRLEGVLDNRTVSYSVSEAYDMIPKDARIAFTCEKVLVPYDRIVISKMKHLIKKENQCAKTL